MEHPSFSLSFRSQDGVATRVDHSGQDKKLAAIWGGFLWRVFSDKGRLVNWAWEGVRSTCSRLFPRDEDKQRKILFNFLPQALFGFAKADRRFTKEEKPERLALLSLAIDPQDRWGLQSKINSLFQKIGL
jgi:hypothetical protein